MTTNEPKWKETLVEIYALIGADGPQCIDRIKDTYRKVGIMTDALNRIYEGAENPKQLALEALEEL